jgi:hypothetical protein
MIRSFSTSTTHPPTHQGRSCAHALSQRVHRNLNRPQAPLGSPTPCLDLICPTQHSLRSKLKPAIQTP